MSVLAEAISVIVPIRVLDEKYPGGVRQYEKDCPNGTFCMDESITRLGFMTPVDVRRFVDRLVRVGLVFFDSGRCVDIALVDQYHGPTARCDWIVYGVHPVGFSLVWRKGMGVKPMAAPAGWTPKQSRSIKFISNEGLPVRTLLLQEGDLDVYLDYSTGKEIFIGRWREDDSPQKD